MNLTDEQIDDLIGSLPTEPIYTDYVHLVRSAAILARAAPGAAEPVAPTDEQITNAERVYKAAEEASPFQDRLDFRHTRARHRAGIAAILAATPVTGDVQALQDAAQAVLLGARPFDMTASESIVANWRLKALDAALAAPAVAPQPPKPMPVDTRDTIEALKREYGTLKTYHGSKYWDFERHVFVGRAIAILGGALKAAQVAAPAVGVQPKQPDVHQTEGNTTSPQAPATMGQWISAEDRTPEPEVDVLCVELLAPGASIMFVDWFSSESDWRRGVTHWMPLPAPPNVNRKDSAAGGGEQDKQNTESAAQHLKGSEQ